MILLMSMGLTQGSQKMSLTAAAVLFYKEICPDKHDKIYFYQECQCFLTLRMEKKICCSQSLFSKQSRKSLYNKWAFPQGSGARDTESDISSPVKHESLGS